MTLDFCKFKRTVIEPKTWPVLDQVATHGQIENKHRLVPDTKIINRHTPDNYKKTYPRYYMT